MKPGSHLFSLSVLCAAALCTGNSSAGQFKRITIDGSFDDWAGVAPAYLDVEDAVGQFDFNEVYVANDDQYLYVRVKLHAQADYGTFHHHVLIDADADSATGHPRLAVGSELMIEDGSGYQQKNGGFNEGGATDLDWASAPAGQITEFEARISRSVLDAEGMPVLVNPSIALVVESQDSNWATTDVAPDAEGLFYDFAETPPKATSSTTIVSLTDAVWRYNDAGADLGTDWRAIEYDDTQAGWSSGAALFGFGVADGVYPNAVQSSMTPGSTTYYLRVPFTWDFDSLGIAFAGDGYLSDGAVFYLNGVEVRRVRMPAGQVEFSMPATGGPAVAGEAETLALPSAALVVGANVLAVELHQAAATPGELAFGLNLLATDSLPPAIEDAAQPADRSIVEGESTSFTAGNVFGTTPLAYQWFKDDVAIDGATNAILTIPVVLFSDAGQYRVEISNATGVTAASRAAELATTAVPVSVVDPSQPADRTITEGETTTLSVAAAGSPVHSYQWFKNGAPIEGAMTAEFTITNAVLADTGDYWIAVSNRVNGVVSRTARVNVVSDTTAPAFARVSGSATKVIAEFSEPLTEASANSAASYSLTGGAQVQAAVLDPADRRTVTLTTSPLTFGANYTLGASGVEDLFGNSGNPTATFRATILIDGDFSDWEGITPLATEFQNSDEGLEFKEIFAADDENYLYLRFSFYADVGQLPVDRYFHIFSDTDNDLATGFPTVGLGSEMMIENGNGYQQKNGQFNEGGLVDMDFLLAPEGSSSEFECRISRKTTYESDGERVYSGDSVGLAVELISNAWSSMDSAPSEGPVAYTFTQAAVITPGPLSVQLSGGNIQLTWTGAGVLESKDDLGSGAWTTVSNATSPFSINPDGKQRYFRLRL